MNETIVTFTNEKGEKESYFVLEETKLNDIKYLLVSDVDESAEEGNAFIMKEISAPNSSESIYELVEESVEFDALADIFAELLGDETDLAD